MRRNTKRFLTPEKEEILHRTHDVFHMLRIRAEVLEEIVRECGRRESSWIEGSLHAIPSKRSKIHYQYYYRRDKSEKMGEYIRQENMQLANDLARTEYERKLQKCASEELRRIRRALDGFETTVDTLYETLPEGKRQLIDSIALSDDVYAEEWLALNYESMPFEETAICYITLRGEKVRSKSEVIIANILDKYHVPYRYEYPLRDELGIWARPDFTALNVHTRKEYYWEHFGMMDNAEYLEHAINKHRAYARHGIVQGGNLICTYETSYNPINTAEVESIVRSLLCE